MLPDGMHKRELVGIWGRTIADTCDAVVSLSPAWKYRASAVPYFRFRISVAFDPTLSTLKI